MKKTMFRGRRYSGKSIVAAVMGGAAVLALLLMIIISGMLKPEAGNMFGAIGIGVFALSIAGLVLAFSSFKERDIYYTVPVIAGVLNSISVISCLVLYIIGSRINI